MPNKSQENLRGFIPQRFRAYDFVRLRKCNLDCWAYAYVLAPVGRVVQWDQDKDSRLIVVKATKCARARPHSYAGTGCRMRFLCGDCSPPAIR